MGATVPANAEVNVTRVQITTAFDAVTDLSVGTAASPVLLARTADIDDSVEDVYIVDGMELGMDGTI